MLLDENELQMNFKKEAIRSQSWCQQGRKTHKENLWSVRFHGFDLCPPKFYSRSIAWVAWLKNHQLCNSQSWVGIILTSERFELIPLKSYVWCLRYLK